MIPISFLSYCSCVLVFSIVVYFWLDESEKRQKLEMKLKLKNRMKQDQLKQRRDIGKPHSYPLTDGMLKVDPKDWKPVSWD